MMKWLQPEKVDLSGYLQEQYGNTHILARELAKRGMLTESQCSEFLDPERYPQTSPFSFIEMEKTVNRIFRAIDNGSVIGIWGDFDVDGQTSTALLVDGLTKFGANTAFHIPIRKTESHGVNLIGFKRFIAKKKPNLVITCDTGISDGESVDYANRHGIDVIITDHHKLPSQLPPAFSIINPHQLPEGHPLSYLAGVGTAYQVIRALAERREDKIIPSRYLDLVALGTIADIAVQKLENRFYSKVGLGQIDKKRFRRPAFQAIFDLAGSHIKRVTENTIGFTLAPRLNAAGRLGDANPNVDLLLSDDPEFCKSLAAELEEMNDTRKESVASARFLAEEKISRTPGILNRSIIILTDAKWKKGVLGIAAGDLASQYNRPVILLHEGKNMLTGSARSIEGIDITEALGQQADLLTGYGGHAAAAGMRLTSENLDAFIHRMERSVSQLMGGVIEQPAVQIDHYLSFADINAELIDELRQLSPFGPGNPSLIFACRKTEIVSHRTIGARDNHLLLKLCDTNGDTGEIIGWNAAGVDLNFEKVDVAFKVQPEEYRSNRQFSLELVDLKEDLSESAPVNTYHYDLDWEDHRHSPEPLRVVRELQKKIPDLQTWHEGSARIRSELGAKTRIELTKSKCLAILSAPPDISVLEQVLTLSGAQKVYLFDYPYQQDKVKEILSAVGGRIKFYLDSDEHEINLDRLAAQIGQTISTTRLAFIWYQAHGDIVIKRENGNYLEILVANNPASPELENITKNLNKSLKETVAFREYYARVVQPEFLFRKRKI